MSWLFVSDAQDRSISKTSRTTTWPARTKISSAHDAMKKYAVRVISAGSSKFGFAKSVTRTCVVVASTNVGNQILRRTSMTSQF